ncbi:MAG: RNA polymerase sigma factor [Deltaproteobacteria bacterium]|nr:RNA polymerase sigma factor [Deltaproteobacteria bacterium]
MAVRKMNKQSGDSKDGRFILGEDEQIVLEYKKGDASRIGDLCRKHHRWVYKLLNIWSNNSQDVEDLANEVWMKVFSNISTYEPCAPFAAWLKKITRNTFLDWCKKRHIPIIDPSKDPEESEYDIVSNIPFIGPDPEVDVIEGEFISKLNLCIEKLSREYKALIKMFLDLKPQRSMAEALGIALGSVNKRLKSAEKMLLDCLKKAGYDNNIGLENMACRGVKIK